MSITERVQSDIIDAMKSKDKEKVSALRMILSELKMGEKESKGVFSEQDEISVLGHEKKRRLQAAEAFQKGGKDERAAKEEEEAALIDSYLPEALGEDELQGIIDESIAEVGASGMQDMGKVMSQVMAKAAGRADGKIVSEMVKKTLSG